MAEHQRVCAVVVTYNRKDLLAGCLDALLSQSYRVEHILVIDNASTDGTGAFLVERGYAADPRVEHVLLPAIVGGAGGFHEGFKRALALQGDWTWAMDDDGLPRDECLEQLLAAPAVAGDFRGPLVLARERIDDQTNDEFAFPGRIDVAGRREVLRTRADAERIGTDGVIVGYASVFNGVLIHRRAVEQIGLPDPKFFIWGDEWDYVLRTRRAGIEPTTVLTAVYWHPRDRTERRTIRFAGTEYEVPRADSPFRNSLLIRNHAYLAYRYRGLIAWLRHTLKYVLYHRTADGCFSWREVIRYSLEGMQGRFSGSGAYRQASTE